MASSNDLDFYLKVYALREIQHSCRQTKSDNFVTPIETQLPFIGHKAVIFSGLTNILTLSFTTDPHHRLLSTVVGNTAPSPSHRSNCSGVSERASPGGLAMETKSNSSNPGTRSVRPILKKPSVRPLGERKSEGGGGGVYPSTPKKKQYIIAVAPFGPTPPQRP